LVQSKQTSCRFIRYAAYAVSPKFPHVPNPLAPGILSLDHPKRLKEPFCVWFQGFLDVLEKSRLPFWKMYQWRQGNFHTRKMESAPKEPKDSSIGLAGSNQIPSSIFTGILISRQFSIVFL